MKNVLQDYGIRKYSVVTRDWGKGRGWLKGPGENWNDGNGLHLNCGGGDITVCLCWYSEHYTKMDVLHYVNCIEKQLLFSKSALQIINHSY